jgi:hypothetical protein
MSNYEQFISILLDENAYGHLLAVYRYGHRACTFRSVLKKNCVYSHGSARGLVRAARCTNASAFGHLALRGMPRNSAVFVKSNECYDSKKG